MVSLRPRTSLNRPSRYAEIDEPVNTRPSFAHQDVQFNPELGASAPFPTLAWDDRRQHPNDALMRFCRDARDMIRPLNFMTFPNGAGSSDDDDESQPCQPRGPTALETENFIRDCVNDAARELKSKHVAWKNEYIRKAAEAAAASDGDHGHHEPANDGTEDNGMFSNVDFGSDTESEEPEVSQLSTSPILAIASLTGLTQDQILKNYTPPAINSWAELPDHMKLAVMYQLAGPTMTV